MLIAEDRENCICDNYVYMQGNCIVIRYRKSSNEKCLICLCVFIYGLYSLWPVDIKSVLCMLLFFYKRLCTFLLTHVIRLEP